MIAETGRSSAQEPNLAPVKKLIYSLADLREGASCHESGDKRLTAPAAEMYDRLPAGLRDHLRHNMSVTARRVLLETQQANTSLPRLRLRLREIRLRPIGRHVFAEDRLHDLRRCSTTCDDPIRHLEEQREDGH